MPFAAVFFDFDGTLLDTESIALLTWVETYRAYDLVLDEPAWVAAVGAEANHYATLANRVGPTFDLEACRDRRRSRENALVDTLQPAEGIEEALAALERSDTRLAVVSSSPARWVLPHLRRLGWLHRFEAVITREDAPLPKPSPALYLAALSRLGLSARDVVAVEDSRNGVTAAVSAGLRCIAIPNPVTLQHDLTHADELCTPATLAAALAGGAA